VTASRARIVAAADDTRRRIERDLHDGAQQRLVALALRLRLAQADVPPGVRAELDGAVAEAVGAVDELREIARGLHPASLAKGGLAAALRMLADRTPIPIELDLRAKGRLPEHVEISTYYVVAEALTNAAKHAHASVAQVTVDTAEDDAGGGDVLRVRVRDDGRGGADLTGGSGLLGLKDRAEALGGRLMVLSAHGAGTIVHAELPLSRVHAVPG
jgi:signal transduction histidine kinase